MLFNLLKSELSTCVCVAHVTNFCMHICGVRKKISTALGDLQSTVA